MLLQVILQCNLIMDQLEALKDNLTELMPIMDHKVEKVEQTVV
jgi:hypothetical protein